MQFPTNKLSQNSLKRCIAHRVLGIVVLTVKLLVKSEKMDN